MPRVNPRQKCKVCEGHTSVVGPISARGKCHRCAANRQGEAIAQITNHDGPHFQHWRRQMAASVGGVLVDNGRHAA